MKFSNCSHDKNSEGATRPGVRRLPPAVCRLPPAPAVCLLVVLFFAGTARAQMVPKPNSPLYGGRPESGPVATGLPKALQNVGIDQKLDQQVPLDIPLRDENGQAVTLGQYFGKRPVILALVYYNCPMLCTQVLNGMVGSFKTLAFQPGQEFEVVTVSFDSRETAPLAAAKKNVYVNYLPEAKRAAATKGWHFLTGDEASIKRLTEAVGFRYQWDESTSQFAHASGIMVLTPEGKLSQYYYGIEYSAKDLRLGLVEASANKIGTTVDQLLLYCFHYDPATGTYGAAILNIVRLAGILTVVGIALLLFLLRRRSAAPVPVSAGGAV
jgi:protein SCO1